MRVLASKSKKQRNKCRVMRWLVFMPEFFGTSRSQCPKFVPELKFSDENAKRDFDSQRISNL